MISRQLGQFGVGANKTIGTQFWSPVSSVPLGDFLPEGLVTIFIVCSGAIFLEIWKFVTNFIFKVLAQ
jgi:hypothetical protein